MSLIPKNCAKAMYRICLGYIPIPWWLVYPISRKNWWNPFTIEFLGYPWNIPFLKKQKHSIDRKFYGISLGYPISQKNRKFLCTRNFLGYRWDISYYKKTDNFYVPEIFWDIPGISHIPKNWKFLCTGFFLGYPWDIPYAEKLKISMYRKFFGISQEYSISQKNW